VFYSARGPNGERITLAAASVVTGNVAAYKKDTGWSKKRAVGHCESKRCYYTAVRRSLPKLHELQLLLCENKRSTVAEMGDRARAKWAEKWPGAAVPLSVGKLGPYLTQCCM